MSERVGRGQDRGTSEYRSGQHLSNLGLSVQGRLHGSFRVAERARKGRIQLGLCLLRGRLFRGFPFPHRNSSGVRVFVSLTACFSAIDV